MPIVNAVSFYQALFTNICFPVMELLFQYIPLMTVTMLLYFTSFTFYFVNGCLGWIPYLKIWLYVLNRGGRSFCEIIRNPNSHEHARPKYLHDCFRNVWMKQKYINKNGSYEHRDLIVSQKRYCNFHLTLLDTILIFFALFSVHTHFYYLGSQ